MPPPLFVDPSEASRFRGLGRRVLPMGGSVPAPRVRQGTVSLLLK